MKKINYKWKTAITLGLLISSFFLGTAFGFLGVILMWVWMRWPKWVKLLISIPFGLIIISSGVVIVYLFGIRPYRIVGNSMFPTYKNGAYVLVKVVKPNELKLKRGEVIVFSNPANNKNLQISRVVGLPYERVMIRSGKVYINGEQLSEASYLPKESVTQGGKFLKEGEEKVVPADKVFVLGDNREYSLDSRAFGFVPRNAIIGKVIFCYWNCK